MTPAPPPTLASRPTRAPHMAWQRVDGELVLLNIDGKELLGVNEVGARLWELIDGVRTVEDLVGAITQEFSVDRAVAHTDVCTYLHALEQAGAVALTAESTP